MCLAAIRKLGSMWRVWLCCISASAYFSLLHLRLSTQFCLAEISFIYRCANTASLGYSWSWTYDIVPASLVSEEELGKTQLDDLCTRWTMSYGYYCRRWFLRFLWRVLFSVVMKLWAFFNSQKPTAVNRAFCVRPPAPLLLPTKAGSTPAGGSVFLVISWRFSTKRAVFTPERWGGRWGSDFRKLVLSTGQCKLKIMSWRYIYLDVQIIR
jgi:hypothetical protein